MKHYGAYKQLAHRRAVLQYLRAYLEENAVEHAGAAAPAQIKCDAVFQQDVIVPTDIVLDELQALDDRILELDKEMARYAMVRNDEPTRTTSSSKPGRRAKR